MRIVVLAAIAALSLAGCRRSHEETETTTNVVEVDPTPAPANVSVVTPPAPVIAKPSNVVVRAAPPPEIDDPTQTRDDADASGMTARIPDDEGTVPATTQSANGTETK